MRRRNAKNAHERVQAREGLMVLDPTLYKGKWNSLFGNNIEVYPAPCVLTTGRIPRLDYA